MQLLAFGGCSDSRAVAQHLSEAADVVVVYEDLNDPRGIAVVAVSEDPNVFLNHLRPRLATGVMAGLSLKPESRCSADVFARLRADLTDVDRSSASHRAESSLAGATKYPPAAAAF
jgi:hypothetical protein